MEAQERHLCPTREGGIESLIVHWITPSACQERQRDLYHKCFTCVHRNGYTGPRKQGVAQERSPESAPAP